MTKKKVDYLEIHNSIIKKIGRGLDKDRFHELNNSKSFSEVTGYISTGSTVLDIMIRNPQTIVDGMGVPIGRLTEISGEEQTGKSLVLASIIANAQKMGAIVVLCNTEHRLSKEFIQVLGVDISPGRFLNAELDTITDVFDVQENTIAAVREQNPDTPILIGWDSIAGTSIKEELEKDYNEHIVGLHAKRMSQGMRKLMPFVTKYKVSLVYTNQLRYKMNTMSPYVDPYVTPGGKAIPHWSSVRIRLTKAGKIKDPKTNHQLGNNVRFTIVKNDISHSNRTCTVPVFTTYGMDDERSIFDQLKQEKILTTTGSYHSVAPRNGKDIKEFVDKKIGKEKFQQKDMLKLLKTNREFKDKIVEFLVKIMYIPYIYKNSVDEFQIDTGE